MIKKAIILAAGKSDRMMPLTADRPKCLLEVSGKPIIQYQIDGLRAAGVQDILMVVGYKKEKIIEALGEGIRYRVYDDFATTNNLHTLWSVAEELDRPCLITFADIICFPEVFKKAISSDGLFTLLVRRDVRENTMRVRFNGHFITEIGNHISLQDGQGIFLGVAAVNKEGTDLLKPQLTQLAVSAGHESDYWTSVINVLAASGIFVCALSINNFWMEVDTPEDLAFVRSLFSGSAKIA